MLYPCNFVYHPDSKKLSWDPDLDPDAVEYQIEYAFDSPIIEWKIAYNGGTDTECDFIQSADAIQVKGKTRTRTGPWHVYSPIEIVVIP